MRWRRSPVMKQLPAGRIRLDRRFLKRTNRVLSCSTEAILPFYILHHAVVHVVAYFVIQWDQDVAVKFFSLLAISLVAVLTLYELFIKRLNPMRFLFGMKIRGRVWGIARPLRTTRQTALTAQNDSTPAMASK